MKDLDSIVFKNFDIDFEDRFAERDPDLNFFNQNVGEPNCNYILEDNFMNLKANNNELSLCFLNVNSLVKKFEDLTQLMFGNSNFNPDFLGLCETKLSNDINDIFNVDGYKMYSLDRSRNSGGLVIYVKDKFLNVKIRNDLTFIHDSIESIFIEFTIENTNYIVGVIYRRPNSDIKRFFDKLHDILDIAAQENKVCYIMGDFNLDLNVGKITNNTKELISLFVGYNFFNCINKPTRVCNTSASIIDHIWTNNLKALKQSYIIYCHISDHFPTVATFNDKNKEKLKSSQEITYRDFSQTNIDNELNNTVWDLVYCTDDPNIAFDNFDCIFSNIFNKCFPLIKKKVRYKNKRKPYINNELYNLIKQKNLLQKKYSKHPITYGKEYRKLRNKVTKEIKNAKTKFYGKKPEGKCRKF